MSATVTAPERVGVLWNPDCFRHGVSLADGKTVDYLTGYNTGNMAYVEGLMRVLHPDVRFYSWETPPARLRESCDIIVFPAANQLGPHTDLGDLANTFYEAKVPIVAV